MKLTDHVIERYSQRCMSIRDMIESEIRSVLSGIDGILYRDSRHGWRIAKPVKTGVFICNRKGTSVITFISKDSLSNKELLNIYRRRYYEEDCNQQRDHTNGNLSRYDKVY